LARLRNYESAFTGHHFRLIASTIFNGSVETKKGFLSKLDKHLKTLSLHSGYLAIMALAADEKSKEIRDVVKDHLKHHIQLRREYSKSKQQQLVNNPALQMHIKPECSLPYLIHMLSHLDLETEDSARMKK
jgi:hypothetical protein